MLIGGLTAVRGGTSKRLEINGVVTPPHHHLDRRAQPGRGQDLLTACVSASQPVWRLSLPAPACLQPAGGRKLSTVVQPCPSAGVPACLCLTANFSDPLSNRALARQTSQTTQIPARQRKSEPRCAEPSQTARIRAVLRRSLANPDRGTQTQGGISPLLTFSECVFPTRRASPLGSIEQAPTQVFRANTCMSQRQRFRLPIKIFNA